MIGKATQLAHLFFQQFILPGDSVVDATCGNGHDTLLMCELVGPSGTVLGLDIQAEAVINTRERIARYSERATIIEGNHADICDWINKCQLGAPRLVAFNLGYLPGGDKAIITNPDSTLKAIEGALSVLEARGAVVLVVYTGHEGGEAESQAINEWVVKLDSKQFGVSIHQWINLPGKPPYLVVIERRF